MEFTFPPSARFEQLLKVAGVDVTWHRRIVGSETDPDTGEPKITWENVTIKAVVEESTTQEIEFGGVVAENKTITVYVHEPIKHLDRITYNGEVYEVGPPKDVYFRNALEYRTAVCRRLQV